MGLPYVNCDDQSEQCKNVEYKFVLHKIALFVRWTTIVFKRIGDFHMATTNLAFPGYATQVNRHTGLDMNDDADGWATVATAISPSSSQGSSLLIHAKSDNAGDLLVKLNGGTAVIPVPAGQGRTFDDFPITSFQVTNADATHKYHYELYLD